MTKLNLTFTVLCPEDLTRDYVSDMAQGSVYTCVGLAAVFLNVLGACVYKRRGFNKSTNRIMFCITVSDIGGGLVGLYIGVYFLVANRCWFDIWYFDDIVCALWPMMWLTFTFGTTLLLPMISTMRFIAVLYPLKFQLLQKNYIMPGLWTILALSVAAAVYPLYPGAGFFKISQAAMCIFNNMQAGKEISIFYAWFFNFLPTVLSVLVILITNSAVLYKMVCKSIAKKKSRVMVTSAVLTNQSTPSNMPEIGMRDLNRTTQPAAKQKLRNKDTQHTSPLISGQTMTIISLAFVYLICYAQKVFIYGLLVFWPSKAFHELLLDFMSATESQRFVLVSDYCVTINSFLNPVIYITFSRRTRIEFLQVLTCNTSRGRGGRGSNTN